MSECERARPARAFGFGLWWTMLTPVGKQETPMNIPAPPSSVLRLPEVRERVGLSKSSIYAFIAAEQFPKPIRIGARAVAWRLSDIEAWLASKSEQNSSPKLSVKENS
ncbi:helix-turn-helix transcriptional regulator [Sulfitobacter sp. PS-8MA]|uniref:helix-turn-helix transcriptional regulator n=1 Tax=Sulfitobacter sp. PS-8MA TaxID=3237707 RepID=UPI0034C5B439